MNQETFDCDGCSNVIVNDIRQGAPAHYEFVLPSGPSEYTSYGFTLCLECRARIVDMLLDDDESAPRVDMVDAVDAVSWYQSEADRAREMAREIEELLDYD